MKRLILVTSPPACGKTYISKKLAENLKHVVYLDKDSLIVLSKQIFVVAREEVNRSSPFFEKHIRDFEYDAIIAIAMEALEYDDIVLINAPFTREVRDKNYMSHLRERLIDKKARLTIIWVQTEVEIVRQRMIERNSDRDTWKIQHWDEYVKGINYDIPKELDDPNVKDDLLIFKNSSEAEFESSMKEILAIIEEE